MGSLAREAWDSLVNVDLKTLRSLKLMVTRPGELTRRFFDNRHAELISPVKMFFVFLFLYSLFFAVSPVQFVQFQIGTRADFGMAPSAEGPFKAEPDRVFVDTTFAQRAQDRVVLPQAEAKVRAGYRSERGLITSLFPLLAAKLDRAKEASSIYTGMTPYLPLVLLIPAVATGVLFYRRRVFFIEHVVLGLEAVGAFFVLAFVAASAASIFPGWRELDRGGGFFLGVLVMLAIYLTAADRAYFRATWPRAAGRALMTTILFQMLADGLSNMLVLWAFELA